jgi:hypothetical protein
MIRRIPVSHIRTNFLFGQKFTASFTISAEPRQLQSSSYAPSIWLGFDEFLLRESHTGFLEVPLRLYTAKFILPLRLKLSLVKNYRSGS